MKWLQKYVQIPFLFAAIGCLPLQLNAVEEPERSLTNVRCLEMENEAQYFYESPGFEMPEDAQIALSNWDRNTFTSSEVWHLAENRNTTIPFHSGRLVQKP